jgi:hypothetical protein
MRGPLEATGARAPRVRPARLQACRDRGGFKYDEHDNAQCTEPRPELLGCHRITSRRIMVVRFIRGGLYGEGMECCF